MANGIRLLSVCNIDIGTGDCLISHNTSANRGSLKIFGNTFLLRSNLHFANSLEDQVRASHGMPDQTIILLVAWSCVLDLLTHANRLQIP